ncbi:TPR-like protein [Suillus cothurnatus]|nr:TPR-like protein [Suillus cothurnatus]
MVDAVEQRRAALKRCPPGHSHRSESLNNLAASLGDRFLQRGVPSDLDESIELFRDALLLRPPGQSLRSHSLNNLAVSLGDGFRQRGVPSDLDECIELHRDALLLRPPGHSHRSSSLNNLANSLGDRFRQQGVPSDLDDLGDRFRQQGVLSDLDECIKLHRDALLLRPPGHSLQSHSLNNLAVSLGDRFRQRGIPSDLDECIELHRDALLLHPPGHSLQSHSLNNLAVSLGDRFTQRGVPSDLDESFNLFTQLPHTSHAVSRQDLAAAKSWATAAEETNHASALLAYQTALKFLDQHVTLLSSSSRNFDVIRMATASLAVDAFSCSIRHRALTTAVELVEQGHAVFWTQLAHLSSPFDELSLPGDTGKVLVEEFKQLSSRLHAMFDWSTEDQSSQIQQLTIQWNDVLSRIRMLPDCSRFLLPPLFSDLQKAADEGPVIIVNASQYSRDALIVLRDQDPVHIPIDITQTYVSELSTEFQSVAEQFGCSDQQDKLVGILRKLWHHIVEPVVQALGVLNDHTRGKETICHRFTSHLIPPHWRHSFVQDSRNPEGGKELQCVAPEVAAIARRLAPIVSSFTSIQDSDATVQVVLDALNDNQWLHLACHGMPNRQRPFESSFAMRDGPLMIKDIIRSNWQNPEFAFLSACHTTVGDENSPDESIHLAAAMQFSGFHSVIGSMWSVDDDVARQVVSTFYDKLVDDSGRLDCRRAVVALHKAVKKLRRDNVPLEQQIVFVHIGI